ncbi:MAG TPA: lipoyl(octanoyl) transferase LipB [Actinomycetota bacterium]|nr:lipoyl(octanoyl) transferase LipB [Actinomycetota bacterium]
MAEGRAAWLLRPEGLVDYDVANEAMHDLARRRLADEIPDAVIVLQHPPVFTAGRRATADELLWDEVTVAARGGAVRRIDRGGSFTFHGPGQLVAYPIVGLGSRPDAAAHLRRLEEVAIRTCADVGVAADRRADVQTGVWVGDDKICAIGVRLLRTRVTLHGMALNCDTDLAWFDGIVACGLPDRGVTSLARVLGRDVPVAEVAPTAVGHIADVFGLTFIDPPDDVVRPFVAAAVA